MDTEAIEAKSDEQQLPEAIMAEPDWFLRTLVDLVTGREMEIGITLQVSGLLVSGLLVSGHKYFAGLATEVPNGVLDEAAAEAVRKFFASFQSIYEKSSGRGETTSTMYIHLKNARFFHADGKPIPANRGVWWRGSLSHVAGFIMGTLAEG